MGMLSLQKKIIVCFYYSNSGSFIKVFVYLFSGWLDLFIYFFKCVPGNPGTKTVSAIGVAVAHFSRFMCIGVGQGFYGAPHLSCHL